MAATIRIRDDGSIGSKIGLTLFFLVFFLVGALMSAVFLWGAVQALATYRWPAVECSILRSRLAERGEGDSEDAPLSFEVEYAYKFGNRDFVSRTYQRGYRGSSDYGQTQELVEKYPPGSLAVCRVNPGNPREAILERESLLPALFVFLPLIFVAVGAGGIYVTWRGKKRRGRSGARADGVSRPRNQEQSISIAVFGLFFLFGVVFLVFFVTPMIRMVEARRWTPTPCRILMSEIRETTDSDGDTLYRPEIVYVYEFGGVERKSNRYEFMDWASSGRAGKVKIINRYPPGSEAVCYVNPARPTQAVLNRGGSPVLLFGLIPLLFVLIGAAGIAGAARKAIRAQAPRA